MQECAEELSFNGFHGKVVKSKFKIQDTTRVNLASKLIKLTFSNSHLNYRLLRKK